MQEISRGFNMKALNYLKIHHRVSVSLKGKPGGKWKVWMGVGIRGRREGLVIDPQPKHGEMTEHGADTRSNMAVSKLLSPASLVSLSSTWPLANYHHQLLSLSSHSAVGAR